MNDLLWGLTLVMHMTRPTPIRFPVSTYTMSLELLEGSTWFPCTLTDVTVDKRNGTYTIGEEIHIHVHLSAPVVVRAPPARFAGSCDASEIRKQRKAKSWAMRR